SSRTPPVMSSYKNRSGVVIFLIGARDNRPKRAAVCTFFPKVFNRSAFPTGRVFDRIYLLRIKTHTAVFRCLNTTAGSKVIYDFQIKILLINARAGRRKNAESVIPARKVVPVAVISCQILHLISC